MTEHRITGEGPDSEPARGSIDSNGSNTHGRLRITVNRRPFDKDSGVKREMKGFEIAALVGVSADNAKVRRDNGSEHGEHVGIDETVTIHSGEKFLVTRKTVEGGNG